MLAHEFLEQSARVYAHKVGIVYEGQCWTYCDIDTRAAALANCMRRTGIACSNRVVVQLDDPFEVAVSIFAILKLSATFVVINPNLKPQTLLGFVRHCQARGLIARWRTLQLVRDDLSRISHLTGVFFGEDSPRGNSNEVPFASMAIHGCCTGTSTLQEITAKEGSPAALVYTSGSTGLPKAVVLSHGNIVSATTTILRYLRNTPSDIILSVLPMSHSYGLTQLMTAFAAGATLVLQRSFQNPQVVLETIQRERVTGFALVPTIAHSLLETDLHKYDLSTLRYVTNAADALSLATIRSLRRLLPHVELFSMYGQTECIRASYLPPELIDIRPTSIGRGLPNSEIYIVDDKGIRLGPGAIGELLVKGPNVMQGYWDLPEETAKVLKPGAGPGEKILHTGDLFEMDRDGYFYFVARKDDMIKTGGERVSPQDVEEVLCSMDGVAEAVVIGVPDTVLGQAIKAVICPREGALLAEQDIIRHCAKYLEIFMIPTIVEFRRSMPRTSSGKVLRRQLRDTVANFSDR